MIKIGVLSLQGGVTEHLQILKHFGNIIPLAVKTKEELNNIDGLILPGGESTTLGKLIATFDLKDTIIDLANHNIPIWGTCAGMILLAKTIEDKKDNHLNLMNITVQRNAYGNQLASFKTNRIIKKLSTKKIPLVFIRAPYVTSIAPQVEVLLEIDNKIVAVEENNLLATSFHPELTESLEFHKYFVEKVTNS